MSALTSYVYLFWFAWPAVWGALLSPTDTDFRRLSLIVVEADPIQASDKLDEWVLCHGSVPEHACRTLLTRTVSLDKPEMFQIFRKKCADLPRSTVVRQYVTAMISLRLNIIEHFDQSKLLDQDERFAAYIQIFKFLSASCQDNYPKVIDFLVDYFADDYFERAKLFKALAANNDAELFDQIFYIDYLVTPRMTIVRNVTALFIYAVLHKGFEVAQYLADSDNWGDYVNLDMVAPHMNSFIRALTAEEFHEVLERFPELEPRLDKLIFKDISRNAFRRAKEKLEFISVLDTMLSASFLEAVIASMARLLSTVEDEEGLDKIIIEACKLVTELFETPGIEIWPSWSSDFVDNIGIIATKYTSNEALLNILDDLTSILYVQLFSSPRNMETIMAIFDKADSWSMKRQAFRDLINSPFTIPEWLKSGMIKSQNMHTALHKMSATYILKRAPNVYDKKILLSQLLLIAGGMPKRARIIAKVLENQGFLELSQHLFILKIYLEDGKKGSKALKELQPVDHEELLSLYEHYKTQ